MDVGDVSISSQASSRRSAGFGAIAVLALAGTWGGCRGSPPDAAEPEGADLVAGTSLFRHGILTLPREGGLPELRAIEDPGSVRWRGEREVPAATEVHALDRLVVLRGADGDVSLYDPAAGTVRTLGDVPADARWIASAGGGAFVSGTHALLVRPGGARELDASGPLVWAAPAASDRVVALVEGGDGHRLQVWEEGDVPVADTAVESAGPVALTGAGREVLLPEGDGRRLVEHALPGLEATERMSLDGPPILLATSPSEHRLFAASASEKRLTAIDRYAWERLERERTEGTVRELRPSVTGDLLLWVDDAGVWALGPAGSSPFEVETEWRADLPIALPGGRVLGVRDDVVRVYGPDTPGGEPVPGADPGAWWVPVRWRPRAIQVLAAASDSTADAAEPEVGERPPASQEVGLTTLGRVAGRALAAGPPPEAAGGERFPDEAPSAPATTPSVPSGFYAVATSSRQLPSLRDLQRSLEGSGFPTQVLPRVDEANETWYRLLVGPYESRDRAEATAGRLRRERGISAWIQEVSGGLEQP